MKVKYFPRKDSGKKVDQIGRAMAATGLVGLIATSPIYTVCKSLSKARDYLTGRDLDDIPSLDEYMDTIKLCSYVTLYGRIPEVERPRAQETTGLGGHL